jgi:hypothetical protein
VGQSPSFRIAFKRVESPLEAFLWRFWCDCDSRQLKSSRIHQKSLENRRENHHQNRLRIATLTISNVSETTRILTRSIYHRSPDESPLNINAI